MYSGPEAFGGRSGLVPADLRRFASPLQSGLGFDATQQDATVGSAAAGTLFGPEAAPVGSAIGSAVGFIQNLFGGSAAVADLSSTVWKQVKAGDALTLQLLNVRATGDGWFDATTGAKLSQEDADFRSESLMAQLIGAQMPRPKAAWLDNTDGHTLTKAESWQRWTSRYGAGATLESVLRQYGPAGAPGPSTTPLPGGQANVNPDGSRTYNGAPYDPNDFFNPYNVAHRPAAIAYRPPTAFTPTLPTLPYNPVIPQQASIIGGLTPTTMLLGVALLAGAVFLSKSGSAGKRGAP